MTGKSAYQLAMASRSMHRSQDMGRLQELGGPETRLAWVDGGAGREGKGIFAGIDTHLAAIAAPLPEGEAKRNVASHLAEAEALALKARAALSPERLADAAPPLGEILKHLQAARAALGTGQGEALAVADLLDEKIAVAETGLAAAAGVAVDAAVGAGREEGKQVEPRDSGRNAG